MPTTHNQLLFLETVGCQMNVLDSELVVAALRADGFELTDRLEDADTVLFNTCSVREHAEHKIYSELGRLKYSKRQRPERVIGVFGCMAQKDQELIFQRAPHVDLVVGTGQLAEIPRLVAEARRSRRRALAVSLARTGGSRDEVAGSFASYDPLRDPTMRPSPFQAYVRIMIGCDKFCTYCVVPTTRGPEQSRPPSQVIAEVRALAGQGVREVTLLGQTVNSYLHVENGRNWRLADLLGAIHDTGGIERIKFVTNFPRDMSTDLLEAIRDLAKVGRYLHVPVQSGSDAVLKRMKRGYTVEEYREMMARISETVPGCAVSSDFIVGFCGETDQDFQASVQLVEECRFKNSFIFKYSPRPGTMADSNLEDDVPEAVKRERNARLLELQTAICEEDNAGFIGRTVEVLVEGPSKTARKRLKRQQPETPQHPVPGVEIDSEGDGTPETLAPGPFGAGPLQLVGRTDCDRIVVFDGNPRLAGSLANISIDDCTATTLIGRIVTREVRHTPLVELPIVG
ncbi:MAG: tRNA (N6-isopentenyl adenosine(37)-C2)-methylthiotransferase MiaB [Planctomycetaceae bacterium]|jgi:tRNA-2-methylthio-N6-dimethylallyladenosine synthase|nr:tRNA (N6-isopentenyl adenosine(37)-C2)-methylthiotransferase MiaB [Planctomycetaceae bacterium]MDP7275651.1 tRNA (N6-isopentenyl adenosine(37)-C2)-methylthiotransferase MiaB [Planctomycetaceae bacterium]